MSASPPSSRWLYGPTLDLLIGCGAWSLPLLAITFFLQRENAVAVSFTFYLLAVFCNNPHYMATVYRAYHTSADFRKYRFFTVYVTVLLLITVGLVHFVPMLFPWAVTIYLTWSPWHYTGQNFGIAQLFIRRGGAPADPAARSLLFGSYAASFAVWFLTLHSTMEGDPNFLSLRIPVRIALPLQIFFSLTFLTFAGGAFFRLSKNLRGWSLVAPLLLTFTQLCWFVAPALLTRFGALKLSASYFSAGALAFMHCAQYLWITTFYAKKERVPEGGRPFSFWRYYLTLVVGGVALFIPGPWLASRLLHRDLVESFLIFMALVNVHHFILDGAIWKLRDGRIARLLLGRQTPGETSAETELAVSGFWSQLRWFASEAPAARWIRYGFAAAILGIGAIDQTQYFMTRRGGDSASLTWAQRLNPQDTRVYFRRAQSAFEAGDMATARTELERVLRVNPYNAPAQHLLGQIIFRSGDTAAALAHYDRMAELFRPDVSVTLNRGLLQQSKGDATAAASLFEEALSLAPHKTELHFLLANALLKKGDADRARKQYELFITLFEEDPGTPEERDAHLPAYLQALLYLANLDREQRNQASAHTRLQRVADVAVTYHLFDYATTALARLAELDDEMGQVEAAAKNRKLAQQTASFAQAAHRP